MDHTFYAAYEKAALGLGCPKDRLTDVWQELSGDSFPLSRKALVIQVSDAMYRLGIDTDDVSIEEVADLV